MSHLIQKGRRRSAKVQDRKRRRGAGPVDEAMEAALLRVARNKFRMLRRSNASAWRNFDRVSFVGPLAKARSLGRKAEAIQRHALAYGRLWGLVGG